MFDSLPRYEEYDPKVPVWCATPNRSGCFHRFFDTSPISPSGRYLAAFQMPREDRRPKPGETGQVCIVDLQTGEDKIVAQSCGWESQMGANINWGGSDHELFFNDVDIKTWQPFAWKLDPLTGKKERMEGTVYHASPDGKLLISSNLTTTSKTQPGYGVLIPQEKARWNVGLPDDDGFYMTDTQTGRSRLFLSFKDILEQATPTLDLGPEERIEIYGFHSKFNLQGDRLMLSLRWFPAKDKPCWDRFSHNHAEVRFAWITAKVDGTEIHNAVGPEQWVKGGHHGTWFPDGKRISMNLRIDGDENLWLVQANYDGTGLGKITDKVPGSGHPTVHPDGVHIVTDTYTFEPTAYGDGTIPIRWINLETGTEQAAVRIKSATGCEDSVMRLDPHPAWDRTWRYVIFNGFVGGTRRVFIADMKPLLEA